MKEIQVTLYDVFGFLFPGAGALAGASQVFYRLNPTLAVDWSAVTAGGWVVFAAVAYFAGHLVQAIANALVKCERPSAEDRVLGEENGESPEIVAVAREKVRGALGLAEDADIAPRTLYAFMDHFLCQNGRTAERDIYVYREGFYRGMAVSACIFALGCFVSSTGPDLTVDGFALHCHLSTKSLIVVGLAGVVSAVLSFLRYRRFSGYRVRNALYGFLSVQMAKKEGVR